MYLYIVGRGHSGSTIMDILLGNSRQIESVGQLLTGLSRADRESCSCGALMSECAFWREVRSRLEAEAFTWNEVCSIPESGPAGLWRVWRAGRRNEALGRRALATQALGRAITTTAGKPHLLDSSKTPAHALLLLRYVPEARVIHLVRDPRQFLRSFVWRVRSGNHLTPHEIYLASRSAAYFLASTALSWTVVNLICDLMARAYPGRVVRVRFEDLCARPGEELERVGRAFELDLADLADLAHRAVEQQPLEVGHNVGGNHLRHAASVRFDSGGGLRVLSLPRWLKATTNLLCGPLMWRYGYGSGDDI